MGGWPRRIATAVAAVALSTIGCASASQGVNARLAVIQSDIDRALEQDELDRALSLAIEFEDRLPGGDSFAALGDVRWRLGELLQAEALQRRAVQAGVPRGYLGLARIDLARGRISEALEHARRAAELPEIAPAAWTIIAAAGWASGRPAAASDALNAAAGEGSDGVLAQEAAIIGDRSTATEAETGDAPRSPIEWHGEHATLGISPGGRIEARVGGVPATLRVLLDGSRSSLTPELAGRISIRDPAEGDAIGAPLTLGDVRTPAAVFRVRASDGAEDGVLGFDLLSTLAWMLDVRGGVLQLSTGGGPEPVGIDPPVLSRTHWATVRIPRLGLGAQLLVVPRLRGEIVRATLDLGGPSRLGLRTLPALSEQGPPPVAAVGEVVEMEVRIGAWRGERPWVLEDLTPLGSGGRVSPQAVIGADLLREWRIRWRPDRGDLRFERHDTSDAEASPADGDSGRSRRAEAGRPIQ